ncbi:nitroreductase [Afipia sp. GAS231]|uniref:nitroreductase n=1 Tax=Afipia sp. GAS231 TaxID=1882747 RepID=UPI00087A3D75|nr:nitroreductase [Afipia sp. GAS231]SDP26494.1 Nitroreductase [Afipia sp. GAS231]
MRAQLNSNYNPKYSEVLADLLQERYSCRGFLPYGVSRVTIETILGIAQRTASWCNSQPWQIAIASAEATQRLREALLQYVQVNRTQPDFPWPSEYHGVYRERRRECGLQLYQSVGVAAGDRRAGELQRLENFRFFGAPHVAIVSTDRKLGTYGAIDCGAYVANFALAAHSVGIASIAQAALAAYPDFWREHLELGEDRRIVCGISFGYEDPDHPANGFQTSRADIAQVVSWVDR